MLKEKFKDIGSPGKMAKNAFFRSVSYCYHFIFMNVGKKTLISSHSEILHEQTKLPSLSGNRYRFTFVDFPWTLTP
jgi:hypothetical protein